jgi:4'-phosphopantetheinyl transferase
VRPELAAGEVHVFELSLDVPVVDCLDEGERARAARFVFERDRRRFTAAHAQLRELLGLLLGRSPESLRFQIGERGKPSIDGLQFNLSHSGDQALVAVHRRLPVGVDIEELRPDVEFRAIAVRSFSPREEAAVLGEPELRPAFYRVWTQKEAFIKVLGEGLAFPLDAFDVSLRPEGGLDACRQRVEASQYWLRTLPCADGFAAALAVAGPPQTLRRWRYREATLVELESLPKMGR